MRLPFTKMQGAGNDFIVLDATRGAIDLTPAQLQRLGDRRFGVGADQILAVERSSTPGIDFRYRIFNGASGDEVEHCGNGARCFVRYVHARGLTDKRTVRVQTVNNVLQLQLRDDGRVTVDMNKPRFDHAALPFDTAGLQPRRGQDGRSEFELWPLAGVELAVLSMGNPHAVLRVADVDAAPVAVLGPQIECDPHFPRRVNVGFVQPLSRNAVRLRVHERDAGETLACGTGACAAVVAGIRLGWLDRVVDVHTHGGTLQIEWPHDEGSVLMTGPAETVFEGEIEL
ncbi:MAG: diaminopimelate epimerase [Rubrivivax sp.]|nr:diaminopimelate epimerase [Rubrivivax sp.]